MKRFILGLVISILSVTSFAKVNETDLIEKTRLWVNTVPIPSGNSGNCMPIAAKLQKYLRKHGHMAKIVAVSRKGHGHAMVMFNLNGGRFDTLVDNGALTDFKLIDRERLYDGSLGKYEGTCSAVDASVGTCFIGKAF